MKMRSYGECDRSHDGTDTTCRHHSGGYAYDSRCEQSHLGR